MCACMCKLPKPTTQQSVRSAQGRDQVTSHVLPPFLSPHSRLSSTPPFSFSFSPLPSPLPSPPLSQHTSHPAPSLLSSSLLSSSSPPLPSSLCTPLLASLPHLPLHILPPP